MVSFGAPAGVVAAAAGLSAFCRQVEEFPDLTSSPSPSPSPPRSPSPSLLDNSCDAEDEESLVTYLQRQLEGRRKPRVCIVGNGAVGAAAARVATQAGVRVEIWGRRETGQYGHGPIPLLASRFDILINTIRLDPAESQCLVLLDPQTLQLTKRRLRVIVDVSCDAHNRQGNALPLYSKFNTFNDPSTRIVQADIGQEREGRDRQRSSQSSTGSFAPVDLIAIPALAALLPRRSSELFSSQLLPFLLSLGECTGKAAEVWTRAREVGRSSLMPFLCPA